jgi:hypothetical protein
LIIKNGLLQKYRPIKKPLKKRVASSGTYTNPALRFSLFPLNFLFGLFHQGVFFLSVCFASFVDLGLVAAFLELAAGVAGVFALSVAATLPVLVFFFVSVAGFAAAVEEADFVSFLVVSFFWVEDEEACLAGVVCA